MISRRSLACGAFLALTFFAGASAISAADPRVIVLLRSADALTADLRHLCVDLAGKPNEWKNNVLPNIDVFLFGVDQTRPIRFDHLMGVEGGHRRQIMVPIENLSTFIKDDLDPISIVAIPVEGQDDLYALGGADFVGWMRIKNGYAVLADASHLADIPADMPPPDDSHSELLKLGYDFAVQFKNSATATTLQTAALAACREHSLAATLERPDETPVAFAFRRLNARHWLEKQEQLFRDSSLMTIGLKLDPRREVGAGRFILSALPDTPLARTIQQQVQRPSRFAGLADQEDSILTGQLNYTLSASTIRQFAEFWNAARRPLEEQIDHTEGLTHSQKQARKEIVRILLEGLTASLDLRKWDGLMQISPNENGTHSGLLAFSMKGPARITRILELLPAANSRFKTELNVNTVGDVAIHKLSISANDPPTLHDFFCSSAELFVGTGPDTLWLCFGDGALNELLAAIAASSAAPDGDGDPTIARLDLRLLPILQLLNRWQMEGNFDLLDVLTGRDRSGAPPSALGDLEWRNIIIDALQGEDDRLHFDVQHIDDRLEGQASVESGILKAIGEVTTEFFRQNRG